MEKQHEDRPLPFYIKSHNGLIILAIICLIFMIFEIINNRFWMPDFEVYYRTAIRLINGDNLYRYIEDGHYIYKYSPTASIFFIPFAIFSFKVAKVLYWLFLTFVIMLGFKASLYLIDNTVFKNNLSKANSIILFAGLTLALHFLRELHLGQVNYLLLVLYILITYYFVNNKIYKTSLLLSASLFIKPFGLIFLPYFIYKRKYKMTVYFLIFAVILALLPVIFYGSFHQLICQYQLWINELSVELKAKQGIFALANQTIFSVFARYTPIKYLLVAPGFIKLYQVLLLLAIAVFFKLFIKYGEKAKNTTVAEFAFLIALIPLLAFTSENAFGFTALALILLYYHFLEFKWIERIFIIISGILIGGNFSEILGHGLSNYIDQHSFVSLGAILVIAMLFIGRKKGTL